MGGRHSKNVTIEPLDRGVNWTTKHHEALHPESRRVNFLASDVSLQHFLESLETPPTQWRSSDRTGRYSREANVLSGLLASKRSYINWKAVSGVSSGRRSALEGDPLVTWLGNFQREIFIEHSSRNGSFSRHIWFLKGTPLRKNALRITGLCLGLLRDGDIPIYIPNYGHFSGGNYDKPI
jgi:hypothetical protein